MIETKRYMLKDMSISDVGAVKAVFATLGVIDHDSDIILPGAIESGKKVRVSAYNHASWDRSLPVGVGSISEVGNELILDGNFFLDTTHGADTYKTIKGLGELVEWSFGFDVLDKDYTTDPVTGHQVRRIKKLKVYEVSPVLLGAGIDTRTIDIKGLGAEPKTYQEHAEMVLDIVSDFVKRSQSIADLRLEKGKSAVSDKNTDGLKAIASGLTEAVAALSKLAEADTVADETKVRSEVAALFAQIEYSELMA